jgi:hypothetical protein
MKSPFKIAGLCALLSALINPVAAQQVSVQERTMAHPHSIAALGRTRSTLRHRQRRHVLGHPANRGFLRTIAD